MRDYAIPPPFDLATRTGYIAVRRVVYNLSLYVHLRKGPKARILVDALGCNCEATCSYNAHCLPEQPPLPTKRTAESITSSLASSLKV